MRNTTFMTNFTTQRTTAGTNQRRDQVIRKAIVLAVLIAVTSAVPATARRAPDWKGPLYHIENNTVQFGNVISGSRAVYTNWSRGVAYDVKATGLEPGNSYTLWVMAFNHPENCVHTPVDHTVKGLRCSMDDHMNPATGFSIMYADGAWAKESTLRFRGVRPAHTSVGGLTDDKVVHGPGLVNPIGAEIHFRVRDHGPRQPDLDDEQTTTFGGGCDLESAPPGFGSGTRGKYRCVEKYGTAS